MSAPEPWWKILGVRRSASQEEIRVAWRKLSRDAHPDRPGGSHDAMARLNAARDEGLAAGAP